MGKSVRAALWPGKSARATQAPLIASPPALAPAAEAAHAAALAHIKQRGSARFEAALQSLQLHASEPSDTTQFPPHASATAAAPSGGYATNWHRAVHPPQAVTAGTAAPETSAASLPSRVSVPARSASALAGRSTSAMADSGPMAGSFRSTGDSSASPVVQDDAFGPPSSRDQRPGPPTGADSEEDCATSARVASPSSAGAPGIARRARVPRVAGLHTGIRSLIPSALQKSPAARPAGGVAKASPGGGPLPTPHIDSAAGTPVGAAVKGAPGGLFFDKENVDSVGRGLQSPGAQLSGAAKARADLRRPPPVVMFSATSEEGDEPQIKAFTPSKWRWGRKETSPKQACTPLTSLRSF